MINEVEEDDGERHELIALTPPVRFFLWLFIILPKLGIVTYLLIIGSRYLTSTESFQDLILNAIALEFIINIDELLFMSLFPESGAKEIDQVKFTHPKKDQNAEEEAAAFVAGYHRSLVFISLAVAWVVLYLNYVQQVIPFYAKDLHLQCPEFYRSTFTLPCPPFTEGCFPYGPAPAPAP